MQLLSRYVALFGLLVSLTIASLSAVAADVPAIAAASNIKFALDKISQQFTKETGLKVRISYGSSGNFVAQIKHGAPFELFLSADERYIDQLYNAKKIDDRGVVYAIGRLAVVVSKYSDMRLDPNLSGVTAKLARNRLHRFAIANPDHAPYGERAKEALNALGLWRSLEGKLIMGENVAQAAQFAVSDSTQGGIIALSLAKAPEFRRHGRYEALPEKLHTPLLQRMVLTPKANTTAKKFYDYIQSEKARKVFKYFGFGFPKAQTK